MKLYRFLVKISLVNNLSVWPQVLCVRCFVQMYWALLTIVSVLSATFTTVITITNKIPLLHHNTSIIITILIIDIVVIMLHYIYQLHLQCHADQFYLQIAIVLDWHIIPAADEPSSDLSGAPALCHNHLHKQVYSLHTSLSNRENLTLKSFVFTLFSTIFICIVCLIV